MIISIRIEGSAAAASPEVPKEPETASSTAESDDEDDFALLGIL